MQYDNVLAMQTALETGLRIDDVLSLKPCNLTGNRLECIAKKTGKKMSRVLPRSLIKLLKNNSNSEWIFPSPRNEHAHKTRQAVWKDVRNACERAGISQHVTPHSSRKTFAVDVMREKGFSVAQKSLQHTNAETTMLYVFADLLTSKNKYVENKIDFDVEEFAEIVANKIYEKIVNFFNAR
jgi:integrase